MREEIKMEYKHTPKTKTALIAAIREEIKLQGERANLNCIDTSAITNMRELFTKFRSFNGDISGWDVSNVTDMSDMFYSSSFRGDISGWNVDKVEYFLPMFKWCRIPQEHRPARFRWKCIMDLEQNIEKLQIVLSREKLLAACESADSENGRLVVPDGLTHIELNLVDKSHKDKIRSIYIPATVNCITYVDSIPESKIEAIEVNPDNKTFCSVNNCILSKDKQVLIIGCKGSVIPDCVTEIGDYAFRGCEGLERITIPSNVQKIGRQVFASCTNLKEVVIENGVQEVGYGAFQYCTSLTNVVLPDSIRNLSTEHFRGCTALSEESLPKDLKAAYNEFGDGFIYGGGIEKDESEDS